MPHGMAWRVTDTCSRARHSAVCHARLLPGLAGRYVTRSLTAASVHSEAGVRQEVIRQRARDCKLQIEERNGETERVTSRLAAYGVKEHTKRKRLHWLLMDKDKGIRPCIYSTSASMHVSVV